MTLDSKNTCTVLLKLDCHFLKMHMVVRTYDQFTRFRHFGCCSYDAELLVDKVPILQFLHGCNLCAQTFGI